MNGAYGVPLLAAQQLATYVNYTCWGLACALAVAVILASLRRR